MGTAIVGGVVLAAFGLAGVYTYKKSKKGGCCGGGCQGCANSPYCHSEKEDKTKPQK